MLIYHYSSATGSYLRSAEARPDPLEHATLVDAALAAARAKQQAAKDAKEKDLRKRSPLTDAEFVAPPRPAPEKFLIPAFATTAAPPAAPKGSEAFFANGAWAIRPIPVSDPTPGPTPAGPTATEEG